MVLEIACKNSKKRFYSVIDLFCRPNDRPYRLYTLAKTGYSAKLIRRLAKFLAKS